MLKKTASGVLASFGSSTGTPEGAPAEYVLRLRLACRTVRLGAPGLEVGTVSSH